MADFGTKFSTFATGISGAMEAAQNFSIVQAIVTAFGALAAKVESGEIDLDAISRTALSIGNAFSVAFLGCIADQSYAFEESMINMSTQTANALKLEQVNWYNAGAYLGQGLANGIASMTGRIKSAAINAAAGASRAISITWQVHSPSRVGFNLGRFFDLGIVGGIDKFSGQIAKSAQNVGEQTVDSARTMLRGLDSSIFDNIDPNPTIRPVMDLTSIQNGVGMIDGMFQSQQMLGQGLFRGMSAMNGLNRLSFDGSRIIGSMSNKDVVSELQSLKGRFDDLNQAVTNMKIVLDSGTLVGSTYTQMDNQLGVLAMHKERGN